MISGGMVTLFVADVPKAIRFYVETLGMKLSSEDKGFAVIDAGDGMRVGLHSGGAAKHGKGNPKVGFFPKMPIREAVAILENRGVTFDVIDGGGVTIANFHDPDGNALYLRQET